MYSSPDATALKERLSLLSPRIWGICVVSLPLGLLASLVVSASTGLALPVAFLFGILGTAIVVSSLVFPVFAVGVVALAGTLDFQFFAFGLTSGSSEMILMLTAPGLAISWLRHRVLLPGFVRLGLVLIIIGAAVPIFLHPQISPDVGWGAIRWLLFANLVAGAAVAIKRIQGSIGVMQILFVVAGTVEAVAGRYQLAGNTRYLGIPSIAGRADGTFSWYSNYTQFLALAVLVAIGLLISSKSGNLTRFFCLVATLFMCSQIVAGLSRGAILSLIGGVIFLSIISVRSARKIAVLVVAMGVVWIYVAFFIPPEALDALLFRLTTVQGEDNYRSSLQSAGWQVLALNPLGIGFNQFSTLLLSGGGFGALAALAHPHFLPTAVALEIGVLGALGFFTVVLGALIGSGRALGKISLSGAVALGPAIALAGSIAQAPVDYFFYETASLMIFALVLSMVVSSLGSKTNKESGQYHREQHRSRT